MLCLSEIAEIATKEIITQIDELAQELTEYETDEKCQYCFRSCLRREIGDVRKFYNKSLVIIFYN